MFEYPKATVVDAKSLKTQYEHDLGQVKEWLLRVAGDVDKHNEEVRNLVPKLAQKRLDELMKAENIGKELGFPPAHIND